MKIWLVGVSDWSSGERVRWRDVAGWKGGREEERYDVIGKAPQAIRHTMSLGERVG